MPHKILVDQFEEYLSGKASQEFHDHLGVCADCRTEVAAMEDLTGMFRLVFENSAAQTDMQPVLGFYNRLASQIVQEQRSKAWGLFSADFVFFRRVAFACLLILASLGGLLVSREASEGGADAASIMAQHDASSPHTESADRDRLLVTLANYHE